MPYDLLIVGGGINGCGIARDAAGRNLRVLLAERGDLAGGASSASTRLIHGGLRYLRQFELGFVRRSLRERDVLRRSAPHLVEPVRFVMPLSADAPPAPVLRMGLWLYDRLGGGRDLSPSGAVDLDRDPAGAPLRPESGSARAFAYWDCRTSDARLTALVAMDAARRGAEIRTRAEVLAGRRDGDVWRVRLRGEGGEREVSARAVVNAAGVWAPEVMRRLRQPPARLRFVLGSHLVVRRLYDHDSAYLLTQPDGRLVFAIPLEEDCTLLGTTEREVDRPPEANPPPDAGEIDYLRKAAARWFGRREELARPVAAFCGARAIADSGSASATRASRDHQLQRSPGLPLLLNVLGGKLTTHRQLAEEAVGGLADVFPRMGPPWTATALLPGGDLPPGGIPQLAGELARACPGGDGPLARRLARAYGTLARELVAGGLGESFGAGLHAAEVEHMMEREWARDAEDALWRRSQIGLRMDAAGRARLESWMRRRKARGTRSDGWGSGQAGRPDWRAGDAHDRSNPDGRTGRNAHWN